jgi:hypothetical protein
VFRGRLSRERLRSSRTHTTAPWSAFRCAALRCSAFLASTSGWGGGFFLSNAERLTIVDDQHLLIKVQRKRVNVPAVAVDLQS